MTSKYILDNSGVFPALFSYMGTSRWLCELLGAPPWHHPWSLQPRAEVGNRFPFGPVAEGCGPKSLQIAPGLVPVLETFANIKKRNPGHPVTNMKDIPARLNSKAAGQKNIDFYCEKERFPEKLRFGVGPNCEKPGVFQL